MADDVVLDVSDFEPPEPLERVLAALEQLGPGQRLRVLHRREPFLLYPILERRGFRYETKPGVEAAVEILIWRTQGNMDDSCEKV